MNHLVGGHVIEDQRDHIGIVESVGNRDEILSVTREVFGPGTVDRQRADALPEDEARGAVANRIDIADHLVTLDKRKRRAVRIGARSLRDVREPHPARAHANAYLARFRGLERQLDLLKLVKSAFSFQLNRSIRPHVTPRSGRTGGASRQRVRASSSAVWTPQTA